MKKTIILNYLCLTLLLMTLCLSVLETYNNINQFGWEWTKTTTIDGQVKEEVVSGIAMLVSLSFIGLIAGGLILSTVQLRSTVTLSAIIESEDTEIQFPKNKPEHWNIACDNKVLIVELEEYSIAIPHRVIDNLRGDGKT